MKIDLILCKSTSRFARNTVDCLENVRLLKSLGIGVIFEKENVNTLTMAKRCPNSKVIGTAMIPDYELEFRGVATIVPKKGAEVPVLMWEIDQQDEINLNRYEGATRS